MADFSEQLRAWGIAWPPNLWAGTSITSTARTGRIDALLRVGDENTLRFLSVEPQIEAIDLSAWLSRIDWVIQGGESGGDARAFDLAWARELRDACGAERVPYFLKQLGAVPMLDLCTVVHVGETVPSQQHTRPAGSSRGAGAFWTGVSVAGSFACTGAVFAGAGAALARSRAAAMASSVLSCRSRLFRSCLLGAASMTSFVVSASQAVPAHASARPCAGAVVRTRLPA
jgi:hypothetical protein